MFWLIAWSILLGMYLILLIFSIYGWKYEDKSFLWIFHSLFFILFSIYWIYQNLQLLK